MLFGHNGFAQRMALEDEGTNREEDMVVRKSTKKCSTLRKEDGIPFSPTVISILVDSESSASIKMSVERKTRCVMFHVQELIYSGLLIQFVELRIIGIDFQYSNIL